MKTFKTGTDYFKKRIALNYDRDVRRMIHHYEEMQDAVFDPVHFKTTKKLRILDLGMGTGNLAELAFKRFPKASVTGIEISPDMIRIAEKKLDKFHKNLRIIEGDFTKVALPENYYDLIVSCMSLHHIADSENKKKLYESLHLALKEHGLISLGDPIKEEEEALTQFYEDRLRRFVKQNCQYANHILKHVTNEDFPERVSDHLLWMRQVGFKKGHLVWKKWNYAVISAQK